MDDLTHPVAESDEQRGHIEGPETIAAIRQSLEDVKAGRITPLEDVRKMIPKWIAKSSSAKDR